MCASTDTARVVNVFGAAHAHHAYVFAKKCANRMKGAGALRHRHLAVGSPPAPGQGRLAGTSRCPLTAGALPARRPRAVPGVATHAQRLHHHHGLKPAHNRLIYACQRTAALGTLPVMLMQPQYLHHLSAEQLREMTPLLLTELRLS